MEKRLKGSKEKKHLMNSTKIFKNTWTVQNCVDRLNGSIFFTSSSTVQVVEYGLKCVLYKYILELFNRSKLNIIIYTLNHYANNYTRGTLAYGHTDI